MKDLLRLSRGLVETFETMQGQMARTIAKGTLLVRRVKLPRSIGGVGEVTALAEFGTGVLANPADRDGEIGAGATGNWWGSTNENGGAEIAIGRLWRWTNPARRFGYTTRHRAGRQSSPT